MTGNLLFDLLISAGGVAALVALSYALGGWRTVTIDEAAARERLSFDEPDFSPARWFVGADGCAAFAVDESGREAAFVFALGDGIATRRALIGTVKASAEGEAVVVLIGDLSRRRLRMAAPDAATAANWASMLGSQP